VSAYAASQNTALEDAGDFRHFLWRRHHQSRALNGFVSELLATDGHLVRRMVAEKGQLTYQQFVDARTADAIVGAVEAHASGDAGMLGYSMFGDADALAIVHTGEELAPGWLAFPYANVRGRPSGIPTMPLLIEDIPTVRLCGGAQLGWSDCKLTLDVAIEQRVSLAEQIDEPIDVLDRLVDWRLETTVLKKGQASSVRLASQKASLDGIRRSSQQRVEASFFIDTSLLKQMEKREGLKAWFVLDFDRRLFCLPSEWCTWWFEMDFPDQIPG
jgi:hypothetical protein